MVFALSAFVACSCAKVKNYKVTWVNEDGTVLEVDDAVEEGLVPTYDGATPTKHSDVRNTYTFKGWDKEVKGVSEDVTYTATYTETPVKYEISFVNDGGALLEKYELQYGETPSYQGLNPSKIADVRYSYEFKGWDKEISPVTGNDTYTATYTTTPIMYEITFLNEDETLLGKYQFEYGVIPEYPEETPIREDSKTYYQASWIPEISEVVENVTYKLQYEPFANKDFVFRYNELENGEIEITGFTDEARGLKNFYIPEIINEKPVTTIGEEAFHNIAGLESLLIPKTLKTIKTKGIAYNNDLISVKFAKNSELEVLEQYAISNNKELIDCILPLSVKQVGNLALCDNTKWEANEGVIDLSGVETCGTWIVASTRISTVKFGANLTSLAGGAFRDNSAQSILSEIIIDSQNPKYFAQEGVVYERLEEGGYKLLNSAKAIAAEITIKEGTKIIAASAFYSPINLSVVNFPESLVEIRSQAFRDCKIKDVRLGKNFETLATDGFYSGSIERVIIEEENPYFTTIDGVIYSKDKKVLVYYPSKKQNAVFTIDSATEEIREYAMSFNDYLAKIVIPVSVKTIRKTAIMNCHGLEEINYLGTVAQWRQVTKISEGTSTYYRYYVNNYNKYVEVITCSDGTIDVYDYSAE